MRVCLACGLEHQSHIRCEVARAMGLAGKVLPTAPSVEGRASGPAPEPEPIRKVKEFLKKVGRPKLNRTPEERRRMRVEYMRRYRGRTT